MPMGATGKLLAYWCVPTPSFILMRYHFLIYETIADMSCISRKEIS